MLVSCCLIPTLAGLETKLNIMASIKPLVACFLPFATLLFTAYLATCAGQNDYKMAPDEAEAAYDILEAVNSAVSWRSLHPDNLCLYGPHGLNCDIDENNVLHVVEFSLGWVAENDNNPQCGRNATISPSFQKLPYLRKLLFYKCFTDRKVVISPVIWSLGASLQHLVFMQNAALVGGIPGELAKLSNLERLVMMDNGLGGSIPPELGELEYLEQLVLSGNQLTGFIPDTVGRLQRLKSLDLSANKLQGNIPVVLSQVKQLEKLDLSFNNLSGSIPPQLGELTSVQLIDLSHNNLSGCLPSSLGNLIELKIFQLSSNGFNGEIPNIWGNLSALTGLGLSSAGFVGRIPASMGKLVTLSYLDLSNNKLQGTVPFTLGHLPNIYEINLSNNGLVGLLPFSADFVAKLGRNLRLNGNPGLCISSEWPLSSTTVVVVGLETCNDEYSSSETVQETASSITRAHSGSPSARFSLLYLIILEISMALLV